MASVPYSKVFQEGDHLILQLKNEMIFEGDYCSGGTNNIDLINVRQHNNPNVLGGLYAFYRNEIDSFYFYKEDIRTELRVKKHEGVKTTTIDLTQKDFTRLQQIARDFVYIQMVDARYYDIIQKIQEAENIAIMPFGMKPEKIAQIKLLAVCTWKEVYLFDFINKKNRYFYPELKDVLESESTCKIVHQGGPLLDILYCNYKICMRNTFDTQVVDLIFEKSKMRKCPKVARNLSECLIEYVKLPTCFLNVAIEASEKSWDDRPLRDDQLKGASQLVSHLLLLKHKMERRFHSEIDSTICKVHNFYSGLDRQVFTSTCKNNAIPENLAQMIPSLGQLMANTQPKTEEFSSNCSEIAESKTEKPVLPLEQLKETSKPKAKKPIRGSEQLPVIAEIKAEGLSALEQLFQMEKPKTEDLKLPLEKFKIKDEPETEKQNQM